MKVRIAYGLGASGLDMDRDGFTALVDGLEALRFDSLWLSERVGSAVPDPVVGLAIAAGRTRRLKLGMSVMVLPGRNPVLVAKQLASLDRLSGGRLLPAFGLGVVDRGEQEAFGVAREARSEWFDDALTLIRKLWTEDMVSHRGPVFRCKGLQVLPKPLQQPLDVWLGGAAKSELRRVGRLGDGWLPSFTTPQQAAAGRVVVEEAASRAGREIDPEHFGALVPYARGELSERLISVISARRPEADPSDLVPVGMPALRRQLERFIENGISKLVVVPTTSPVDWQDELNDVSDALFQLC